MKEFVANNSRWKCACSIALGIGFICLGMWMIGAFGPPPISKRHSPAFGLFIGALCFAIFVPTVIRLGLRWWNAADYLRIDALGIRYIGWSEEVIPWSAIKSVTERTASHQRIIVVSLYEPERYPRGGLVGLLGWPDGWFRGGLIDIFLTGTDQSFNAAMGAIGRFKRHAEREVNLGSDPSETAK